VTRDEHNAGVPRTGGLLVLLAGLLLAAAQPRPTAAAVAPGALLRSLFGGTLVRAEVIVREGEGVRDLRVDRGRVRAVGMREVSLVERDGTVVSIPVAVNASVTMRGAPSPFETIKRGMQITTVRDRDQPAQYVVQPAQAWSKDLVRLLFGVQMIRAEVIVLNGTVRDVRIDHGEIVAVRRRVVRLREHDGRLVAVQVATGATITLDGRRAPWAWLRTGMTATVLRVGDGAASIVQASAAGR
jgi:hypothetical protein